MRIFLDTAPLIYLLEGEATLREKSRKQFEEWTYEGSTFLSTVLTRAELIIRPIKVNDLTTQEYLQSFLDDLVGEPLIAIDSGICDLAAEYRANLGYKMIDAIQLAAAVRNECRIFYTNDRRLAEFSALQVVLVER